VLRVKDFDVRYTIYDLRFTTCARKGIYNSRITHDASRITDHAPRTTYYVSIGLVLLVVLGLALWWLLIPGDDGSLVDIRRRGVLRVGLDASFPPFEMLDANGQIIGLDVDIAQAIAADLGVQLEPVNIGFDGLYDALLARRVDVIISGLPVDPRLTQDVAYSHNYFNAGQMLVTRVDEATMKSGTDLAGRSVAVEWGSQAEMEARRLQNSPSPPAPLPEGEGRRGEGFSLLRQESAAAALAAVVNGQAEAAIVDAPSALNTLTPFLTLPLPGGEGALTPSLSEMEGGGGGGLKIVTYLTDEWYAAAVHLESRELLAAVNQTLMRLEESGEMGRLQVKWFHSE
jgi:ABC-type amino acid transport substrate-binding protein